MSPPSSSARLDALKAWIGREAVYEAPEALGQASIRYFALALEDDNPAYREPGTADFGGIIAPPTLVCETNQFYGQAADAHGYFGHAWPLPLDDLNFVRGANDYTFHAPVRPEDRITVTWRILDIFERETRQGGPRLFVVSEARYTNQEGTLLAVNRETNVYRP